MWSPLRRDNVSIVRPRSAKKEDDDSLGRSRCVFSENLRVNPILKHFRFFVSLGSLLFSDVHAEFPGSKSEFYTVSGGIKTGSSCDSGCQKLPSSTVIWANVWLLSEKLSVLFTDVVERVESIIEVYIFYRLNAVS
jgi:hypothetical protein